MNRLYRERRSALTSEIGARPSFETHRVTVPCTSHTWPEQRSSTQSISVLTIEKSPFGERWTSSSIARLRRRAWSRGPGSRIGRYPVDAHRLAGLRDAGPI